MKIDIVTFSSDSSQMYYEFWEPMSKHIKTKFNMHPVLLFCGDDNISLSEEYGDVHRVDSVNGVADYHSATWGRFWITSKYQNKVCMTGDIDMIPLSHQFFIDDVERYDDDAYVHLSAGWYYNGDTEAWKNQYNILSAYYHVAKGKTFKDVYAFEEKFEDEMKKFEEPDYTGKNKGMGRVVGYAFHPEPHLRYASVDNGGKWGQDEFYSTELLRLYHSNGGKVVTENKEHKQRRIDRNHWKHDPSLVQSGFYVDAHSLRPYGKYKEHVDFLMSNVNEYGSGVVK